MEMSGKNKFIKADPDIDAIAIQLKNTVLNHSCFEPRTTKNDNQAHLNHLHPKTSRNNLPQKIGKVQKNKPTTSNQNQQVQTHRSSGLRPDKHISITTKTNKSSIAAFNGAKSVAQREPRVSVPLPSSSAVADSAVFPYWLVKARKLRKKERAVELGIGVHPNNSTHLDVRTAPEKIASLKLKLFHGTSLSYAQSILATNNCNAIRPSLSGHMGAGIYLAREDKAAHFARDASERGLGFGPGIVFKCQVTARKAKFVKHADDAGDWQNEGYDSVRCDSTAMSPWMEWCFMHSAQVRILAYRTLDQPIRWITPVTN